MKALLLVDLQNDFCPGGALAVAGGDEVIPIANRLARSFDLVLATQDWHPADHCSFAANNPDHKVGEIIELDGIEQALWPIHCVADTPGAAFAPGLETGRFTEVFRKGTDRRIDSYSGFYDNGHKRATGLADYLRDKQVDQLYIMGLATDYCVRFTVLDACDEGFDTYLVEDGCRAVNVRPGDGDAAIDEMREAGVTIVSSGQICS